MFETASPNGEKPKKTDLWVIEIRLHEIMAEMPEFMHPHRSQRYDIDKPTGEFALPAIVKKNMPNASKMTSADIVKHQ